MNLRPILLENRFVRLEPFSEALRDEAQTALDCDPDAWGGMVTAAYGPHFEVWWSAAMKGLEERLARLA